MYSMGIGIKLNENNTLLCILHVMLKHSHRVLKYMNHRRRYEIKTNILRKMLENWINMLEDIYI